MNRRTSDDRLAELAKVFDQRFSARVRNDLTEHVVGAYCAAPLGPHDYHTARVVRALGKASIAGKEIVISLGNNGPWAVGNIVIGEPGNFVMRPGAFGSYEDALRCVFSLRCAAFRARHADDRQDLQEQGQPQ